MNHNQELTPTDIDWYNAGIMAQRILQNDEIETLKAKFKKEEQDHYYTRCAWEETSKERDELKNQNLALQDRIRIMQEKINGACTCITNKSGLVIEKCLNH